jgi:polyisoprenoid-binding protein YceI
MNILYRTQVNPKKLLGILVAAELAFSALAACDDSSKTSGAAPTSAPASAAPLASAAATNSGASVASAPPEPAKPAPSTETPAFEPAAYAIDPSHSRVGFSVRHLMVSNVRGEFKKFTGKAFIDERNPSACKVDLDVDPASVDTGEAKRDAHLRSPDFFDTAKFPKLTFVSTSVERRGPGWAITGDLTIHGVTKSVTLETDALSGEVKDPWGNARRGAHAHAKIDRKDFGLTWNKALETGGVVVGDDVTLDLDVELIKQIVSAKK